MTNFWFLIEDSVPPTLPVTILDVTLTKVIMVENLLINRNHVCHSCRLFMAAHARSLRTL